MIIVFSDFSVALLLLFLKWWFLGVFIACYLHCKGEEDLVVSSSCQLAVLKMKIYSRTAFNNKTAFSSVEKKNHKRGIVKCECFHLDQKTIYVVDVLQATILNKQHSTISKGLRQRSPLPNQVPVWPA